MVARLRRGRCGGASHRATPDFAVLAAVPPAGNAADPLRRRSKQVPVRRGVSRLRAGRLVGWVAPHTSEARPGPGLSTRSRSSLVEDAPLDGRSSLGPIPRASRRRGSLRSPRLAPSRRLVQLGSAARCDHDQEPIGGVPDTGHRTPPLPPPVPFTTLSTLLLPLHRHPADSPTLHRRTAQKRQHRV